ncbi:hypothetical protein G6F31_020620 [Rhizopus arrhizus]|nr:hypothetical protein G6F31_020620 [Rhizopus arrhizus]
MTGTSAVVRARRNVRPALSPAPRSAWKSRRSLPAVKCSPAPGRITADTDRSADASEICSVKAAYVAVSSALWRSWRSMVSVRTAPSRATFRPALMRRSWRPVARALRRTRGAACRRSCGGVRCWRCPPRPGPRPRCLSTA